MNILCIDIGGTNIKYTLFQNGLHSEIQSISTPAYLKIEDMKKAVFPIIDNILNTGVVIDFISFSTCGQMRDNVVVYTSSKPGYIGCDWSKIIKEKYNIPCIANNDLHCAVMGEYHFGLDSTQDKPNNFTCLAIGTGINVGVIINKELFAGDKNLSCYLDNVTDLDGNNQFKCASTSSLLKLYLENSGKSVDGKQFISLLKNNDVCALNTYKTWIHRVANIIKCVLYMYNINTLSICGGIINSDYPILDDIKKELPNVMAKPYYQDLILHKSTLSSSQLYGAYAFALKTMSI